jgi:hypothetical protein
MTFDGTDRRSGKDRRSSFSAQGPGGFKVNMHGTGVVIGYLLGMVSMAGLWLWTLVK